MNVCILYIIKLEKYSNSLCFVSAHVCVCVGHTVKIEHYFPYHIQHFPRGTPSSRNFSPLCLLFILIQTVLTFSKLAEYKQHFFY